MAAKQAGLRRAHVFNAIKSTARFAASGTVERIPPASAAGWYVEAMAELVREEEAAC